MSRKLFGITMDEFLYQHDALAISEMLHQLTKNSEKESDNDSTPSEMPGINFI